MRRCLSLAAAMLTVVLLIAGCTGSDDSADETTTAAPATTVAPAETVAASAPTTTASVTAEAGPIDGVVASFDGTTCIYQGPEQVSPTAPFTISFTNESDVTAALFITGHEGRQLEEMRSLIGQDVDKRQETATEAQTSGVRLPVQIQVEPGESFTQNALLETGIWMVDCHIYEPGFGGPAHMWYVGIIESK